MLRVSVMAILAMFSVTPAANAEGRELLGHGRLTSNDLLGDLHDRWQSGSVSSSRVVARDWAGILPNRPFDLLEYRLGGQVITPEDLRSPAPGDRPFAGVLSLGVHTHFLKGRTEVALGADVVATGPQTGLSDLQTAIHDGLGVSSASKSVLSNQVENGFHPTLVTEAGRTFSLGGQAVLRPFAEARWGAETIARVGADLTIGTVGQGELLVRDPVTGQRYRSVTNPLAGFSYVVGADLAHVDSSVFLPSSSGAKLTETRNRVRAGVHWQNNDKAAFYGITWLSEEFEAQDTGQFVGSVRLNLQF